MNGIGFIVALGLVYAIQGRGLEKDGEFYSGFNNYAGEERIVGGKDAVNHSQPWMVYVQASDSLCGGALVQPQWVLTAAHCADGAPAGYKVAAGTNKICRIERGQRIEDYGDGVLRNVSKIFMKNYNNVTIENDIALMKLSQPFSTTGENIKTIALATSEYAPDYQLQVSGWGDIRRNSPDYECWLKTTSLPVVAFKKCQMFQQYNFTIDSRICAGYSKKSTAVCDGDSGSPLVDLGGPIPLIVGVTSQGRWSCNGYSFYTKVKHFSKWILDTIEKN